MDGGASLHAMTSVREKTIEAISTSVSRSVVEGEAQSVETLPLVPFYQKNFPIFRFSIKRYFDILINLLNYKIQLLLLCVKLQESGDLVLSNSLAEMDFAVLRSHRPSLFSSAVPPIQLRRRWSDI